MTSRITRRRALAGASSLLLLPLAGCATRETRSDGPAGVFAHGVASGDPDTNSVVLWTRLSGYSGPAEVAWTIARDPSFRTPAGSGTIATDAGRDYTCKVVVEQLEPGTTYYYRFDADGERSIAGRTRTLPVGHLERLGIAVASCTNYPFGHFNAYEAIALDPAIDVVLHLGDYLYEYGPDSYGGETGYEIDRIHEPRHEVISLADYRARHAQYKRDPKSRAMHAAHPLIAIWDDHEFANNPWMNGAQNHQPDTEGDWLARRDAAVRAYFEWMPVREPATGHKRIDYWRHYRFGDLASLVTLETRHTGRALQIDYADYSDGLATAADAARFRRDVLGRPGRTMLSTAMETFVAGALRESVDEGRRWRVLGNQVPLARTNVPQLDHPFFTALLADDTLPGAGRARQLAWLGELDLPLYLDTWDGYAWARERFYKLCADNGARDLLVLTGDSHSFWSNRLFDASGRAMGLELGTSGITSPGDFVDFGARGATLMTELLAAHNEEIDWTDCQHQGYVRLQLTHDGATADYVAMSDILMPDYQARVLRSVAIDNAGGSLRYHEDYS